MSFAGVGGSRHWAWSAATALALAACEEQPTRPSADVSLVAATQPALASHAHGGRHSGRERYADHGHRPDWGRSGGAAVSAQALVDKTGRADLVVTSYAARDTTTPAGTIVTLVVSALASGYGRWHGADVVLFVRTFTHLAGGGSDTVSLPGVTPGLELRVLALVRDAGGRRTDVVTATTVVLKGPDLAVGSMSGAAQALVGMPVLVTAVVTELNGQVGARADCNLYDGAAKVDSAPGIWVDAGSAVTCAFAPTFGTSGPHVLVARVENVAPRDYDPGNNAGTLTLPVLAGLELGVLPPGYLPAFVFDAGAADVVGSYADTTWTYDFDPSGAPLDSLYADTADTGRLQTSEFHGTIYDAVPFPVARWSLGQSSGGASLDTLEAVNVAGAAGAAGVACADRSSGGVLRLLCVYDPDAVFPLGRTTVDYVRFAGLVTYESRSYEYVYGGGPCVDSASCWDDNAANQATGAAGPWASPLTVTARVEAGGFTYRALAAVPLATSLVTTNLPKTCSTTTYPFGTHVFCEALRVAQTVTGGTLHGVGSTTSP